MKSKMKKNKNVMRLVISVLFGLVAVTGVSMFLALKGILDPAMIITCAGETIFEKVHMVTGMALVVVGTLHAIVEYKDAKNQKRNKELMYELER